MDFSGGEADERGERKGHLIYFRLEFGAFGGALGAVKVLSVLQMLMKSGILEGGSCFKYWPAVRDHRILEVWK